MLYEAGWIQLKHNYDGIPTLLVKFDSTGHGYDLALTDLTTIWVETLSERDVSTRAEASGCSISPGDDIDQLRILLAKIHDALSGNEGTSISFEPGNGSDNITMVLNATLPKPLAPFVWRACLERAEPGELTTAIVSPLLQLAHRQRREMQYLLGQLQHKDHVITKLLDRMESANIHLTDVFLLPNVRLSKQKSQRDQFAKHVPGLAAFHSKPDRKLATDPPSSDELYSILEDMPRAGAEGRVTHPFPSNGWWLNVKSTAQSRADSRPEPSIDLDGDETEDDDFQARMASDRRRASTNDRLRQTQDVQSHAPVTTRDSPSRPPTGPVILSAVDLAHDEDAETTDEDQASSPPSQMRASSRSMSPSKSLAGEGESLPQPRRLGVIGGARKPKPPSSVKERNAAHSPPPITNAALTVSSDRRTVSQTPPPESTPIAKVSPAKRRIGIIGGRTGSSQTSSQTLRDVSPPLDQVSQSQSVYEPKPRRELQQSKPLSPTIACRHSRLDEREERMEDAPRLRETSEERANKRREELKHQLQSKVPAKKKRRF